MEHYNYIEFRDCASVESNYREEFREVILHSAVELQSDLPYAIVARGKVSRFASLNIRELLSGMNYQIIVLRIVIDNDS